MKALTIWQPWATLIAVGAKPYEFRSWAAPRWVIGKRIAIHAGARPVRKAEVSDLIYRLGTKTGTCPCLRPEIAMQLLARVLSGFPLPLSCIVATAVVGEPKLGNACAKEFGWNAGNDSDREGPFNWGWPMLDVEPVMPPVEARGAQGIWDFSGSLNQAPPRARAEED